MGNTNEPVPVMDTSQHQMMKDAVGEDFMALIADFFTDCNRYANDLTALAEAKDANGFFELSHELKGSAALLGFSGISACAACWESDARNGQVPEVAWVKETFSRLVTDTRAVIESQTD
jgi:HPt (histidine-containing phosphotransfer) domain-containing protein